MAERPASPLKYQSLKECVKEYLKREMEGGKLNPGEEIDEKALCQVLNISRTPIREALIELEKEGYVEIIPRKAIRVKKLSQKEIKDMFDVIGILESEAAEIAVGLLRDEDIVRMEEIYKKMYSAYRKNNMESYYDLNKQLHNIHISLCDNKVLLDIINQLKERLWEFPKVLLNIPEWEEMLLKDHANLIELFKKRDKRGVSKLIREKHWNFERNYSFLVKYYGMKEESEESHQAKGL